MPVAEDVSTAIAAFHVYVCWLIVIGQFFNVTIIKTNNNITCGCRTHVLNHFNFKRGVRREVKEGK